MTPTIFFISRSRQSYTKPVTVSERILKLKTLSQPAWHVSERSQSDLHCDGHLRDFSEMFQKIWHIRDVFKTPQIHFKKDVFFVTSLRRPKTSQKRSLSCDVCKSSLCFKKDVYFVTSLRRLRGISCKYLWFFKNTQENMVSRDFCRVIKISDKIDV